MHAITNGVSVEAMRLYLVSIAALVSSGTLASVEDYRHVGTHCSVYVDSVAKRDVNKGRIFCSASFPDPSERRAVMEKCRVLLSQNPPLIICGGRGFAKVEDRCRVSMMGDRGTISCR